MSVEESLDKIIDWLKEARRSTPYAKRELVIRHDFDGINATVREDDDEVTFTRGDTTTVLTRLARRLGHIELEMARTQMREAEKRSNEAEKERERARDKFEEEVAKWAAATKAADGDLPEPDDDTE